MLIDMVLTQLLKSGVVLAQVIEEEAGVSDGGLPPWVMKLAIVLAVGAVTFPLVLAVAFPVILKGATKIMPLSLYGRCVATAFSLTLLVSLVLFWNDLLAGPSSNQINNWPRGVAVLAWIVLSWLPTSIWSSRRAAKP